MADASTSERGPGPDSDLGYLFRLACQGFRADLEHALRPHALTVAQYGALSVFDAAPQMSSAQLSRLAAVTPQTMNTVVHQLAALGLLTQRPHPTHGKIVELTLSPEGRTLLDQATPAVRAVERAALIGLSKSDARIVTNWLATLARSASHERSGADAE